MQPRVFRKVSLERLASPEQLDQVMQVTTARGWVVLAILALLLVTAIVWGVVGQVAEKVVGRGILVRSGGVLEVVASASGRVVDVAVAVGDSVKEGQVVARLVQPELVDQLEAARQGLADLREMHRQDMESARRETLLEERGLAQQQANLEQSIAANEDILRWLGERLASQQSLVEQGLITRATLLATRQQHDQLKESVRASRSELTQLSVRSVGIRNQLEESERSGRLRIDQAQQSLAQVERDYSASTQILSPYTGRILELMTEPGKIVTRGEPVLSLDRTGQSVQDLVAIIYIPSLHGKMVRPGMPIHVSPNTVRQEEFGFMLGTVTFVSDFPATPRGMLRVLKNEQLVQELSGGGATYEVHANLTVDPTTPSQYRWSSSDGPPIRIESGTVAAAAVMVDAQAPIAMVIPLFRRWTGI